MKLNDLLNEATFDLDAQVDYIWDNYFADYTEGIMQGAGMDADVEWFRSTELPKSDVIDKANDINPVDIYLHKVSKRYSCMYIPSQQRITIAFNKDAVDFIAYSGGIHGAVSRLQNDGQWRKAKSIVMEFSEARVKGSIYHELSHWLDDTLHNQNINKTLEKAQKAKPKNQRKVLNQNNPNVALTSFERDAQIHSIKQLKRTYSDDWDSYTFDEMISLNPSLDTIYHNAKDGGYSSKPYVDKWKKLILKRMDREGLLGYNMR
jgi:hypothetical protein